MAISEHAHEFAGKPIVDWEPEQPLADATNTLPRLSITYSENEKKLTWPDKFSTFLDHPDASQVTGLVIGAWDRDFSGGDSGAVVEALANAGDRLPNLTAIFFGDITYEECEISWIRQSDITPILRAYPRLEMLTLRGGDGLKLEPVVHDRLKELVIQTGGMDAEVLRSICASQLPALEHLELWLGTDEYGGNVTPEELEPIFSGKLFPNLRYLGLRDSDIADGVAQAIADAPILERLEVLDLSLGTLGDEGAQALLDSPRVAGLKKLDINHHFCSEALTEKLQQLPLEVDAGEGQTPEAYDDETWRFVAHSE